MKIKKILIFIYTFMAIALFSNNVQNVYASEVSSLTGMQSTKVNYIYFDKHENSYYDVRENGYIDKVYIVENGKIISSIAPSEYVEMLYKEDIEEAYFAKMLNINNNIDTNENSPLNYYDSIYTESSNRETHLYGEKASITLVNEGPGDDSLSLAYNASKSHELDVNLDTPEFSALKAGVSYTWSSSASVSSEGIMTIKAGYEGYFRFDPLVRISSGVVKNYTDGYLLSTKSVRATYPVKKYGLLDGRLVSVKTEINPSNKEFFIHK